MAGNEEPKEKSETFRKNWDWIQASILVIAYELDTTDPESDSKRDRDALMKYIKTPKHDAARLDLSCYAIKTTDDVDTVRDEIHKHLAPKDTVVVLRMAPPVAGFHNAEIRNWFKNLPPERRY